MCEGFVVRHYAAPVLYSPHGLLTKNKDLVPAEVVSLLGQSSEAFVASIVEGLANVTDAAGGSVPPTLKVAGCWQAT
jgi:myosin heavy subunit